jgi:predicted nucleotidyltransferase
MFTRDDREEVLRLLLDKAVAEPGVIAAALVGSGARGTTDQWSDLDLALRLSPDASLEAVVEGWTAFVYDRFAAADHLDVRADRALYRVFLLPKSLQVDLSFWNSDAFASNGEPFRLLFGDANPAVTPPLPRAEHYVGMGWLHGLHARSAIARSRPWQATYMLNGMRDQVIALACLRLGLPPHQGRGVDALPEEVVGGLSRTLITSLRRTELIRVLGELPAALLAESELVDAEVAARLRQPLDELVMSIQATVSDATD